MSHVAHVRTGIVRPQDEAEQAAFLDLLDRALGVIAKKYQGAEVCDYYLNYANRRITPTTGLAIRTQMARRGIGLDINRAGELVFSCDSYGAYNEFEQLKTDIRQTVKTMMAMQILEDMGLVAGIEIDEANGIYTAVGTGVINL